MTHAGKARAFTADRERTSWHDRALWFVRAKRDAAAALVPEWEELRRTAALIKRVTLSRLADYLEQFEENATRRGARVHWARDGAELCETVLGILRGKKATRVVKSKSMLTEECGLNPYLERHGIEVVDTDLGERIVQLRNEPPSHIVLPAIHLRKEDVSALFAERLGTEPGNADPQYLVEAARAHLREKFLAAEAGITGVNFAIAETGGIVVCTNEGNADLGTSLPRVHIACAGIEKVVPGTAELAVFLRLLARSATGQPVTAYTSHFHGPPADGELHIVLVDNGRSEILGDAEFRSALACLRCGACLNTCPVFRRSGGHSYGTTVAGPIGSVLAPFRDARAHGDLPYACSLCGSCAAICPTEVELDRQLLAWRRRLVARGPSGRRLLLGLLGFVLRHPRLYRAAGFGLRRLVPRFLLRTGNVWARERGLPDLPGKSFQGSYEERHGE